ncbi:hypothetical protein DES35_102126 [Schleiferia thermophila]|uniref:Uncharacterized protein n=1 Tax=Schleiferia thermophila TaxID=884107 RepID=A0A369A394_9FLAO|nr:hypothetical protein DES35_102126 [Schleiferia thermophila]
MSRSGRACVAHGRGGGARASHRSPLCHARSARGIGAADRPPAARGKRPGEAPKKTLQKFVSDIAPIVHLLKSNVLYGAVAELQGLADVRCKGCDGQYTAT